MLRWWCLSHCHNKEDQPCVTIPKKRLQIAAAAFKRRFADHACASLNEVFSADAVAQMVEEEVGAHRERLYPPLSTLGLFIEQALSFDGACQDAVARYLSQRTALGESACSLSTGPYCKARSRLPLSLIQRLGVAAGERLEAMSRVHWKWRGRTVKLVDGTTIGMPDTIANQQAYPQIGEQKPGLGFPLALMVALISLSTGAVLRWAMGPCRGKGTGEQALFRSLMDHLCAGDIVLVDRFHCTYFTVAMLVQRGVDLLTRQHQRRLSDFTQGQRLGPRDRLVKWTRPKRPPWMDQATYERMPEALWVRQTQVGGRVLISTLSDARHIRPAALDQLYRQRWQVEVDLRSIKAVMGMDILRTKTPAMVEKEIAVYVLAYNLVRALMARAASATHVLARALSFKASLQLLLAFQQQLRWIANKRTAVMIAHMLGAIAQMRLPIRPGRVEPHAIKRRPKPHALLTVPRYIAREQILQSRAQRALKVVP